MARRILVSFDDTSRTEPALRYACSTFPNDEIVVLYTIDPNIDRTASIGWGNSSNQYEQWVQSRQEYSKKVFARATEIAAEYGASLTPVLAHGRTHRAIIDQYENGDVDFVVLGLRGRSRIQSYIQGDIFERVLRTAETQIPMIPVRASWTPTHTHESPDDPRRIVVPFDGSPEAEYGLEFACRTFPDATIVATYVESHTPQVVSRDRVGNESIVDDLLDEYREQGESVFARATEIAEEHGATLETATGYGPVKEALIDYATEHDVDLIVLGVGGHPSGMSLLFEPLVGQLIQNAPVPVLSVRDPNDGRGL